MNIQNSLLLNSSSANSKKIVHEVLYLHIFLLRFLIVYEQFKYIYIFQIQM